MSKRNKKPRGRPFAVTFTRDVPDPNLQYQEIVIHVNAASVEEARNIASRQAVNKLTHRSPLPRDVANYCWCRDVRKESYGYIGAQWPRHSNTKRLSVPYFMTRRLKIEVTLGNLPIQLEFDF